MIFKLTIRCGHASAACCAIQVLESFPSKCRTDLPSNGKRLPNCPNKHLSYLQYNSEFQSGYKTRENDSEVHQHSITLAILTRLRAGCLMGYGNKIFSPVSRNDVTRSPGNTPSHTNVCKFFNFRHIFSADISPEMLKLCRVTKVKVLFLVLVFLHILRKPNSIIALLFIQNISLFLKEFCHFALCFSLTKNNSSSTSSPGFKVNGSIICSGLHFCDIILASPVQ